MSNLPNQVILVLAERGHRLHHFLWHAVRDNWLTFDEEIKQEFRNIGWEPPRPSYGNGSALENNNSGEDFLFMHRQMIVMVNEILARIGDPQYPKVEGWKTIPVPNDNTYPVPPVWEGASNSMQTTKTEAFFNSFIRREEEKFTNLNELASFTLGQLGSKIEYGIHNAMHLRWASKPPDGDPAIDPFNSDAIDPRWDDPTYDYLADPYSSHVNPIFWKLHGWIDERIEDWKHVHGITGPIPWSVQWDKNMMPHHHHHLVHTTDTAFMVTNRTNEDESDKMLEAVKIIKKAKIFPPFERIAGL